MNKIIIAMLATASLAFAAEGQVDTPHPHWDVDGDKALNKEEWVARAAARFDIVDTNKDGKVTREEAVAGAKVHREKRKEAREERREERKEKREERKEAK
jgi:hypothetical protein